ncbi:MAG: hypothetical protein RL129_619 [Actinomycetota bacterium]|jgi:hypothetical protein
MKLLLIGLSVLLLSACANTQALLAIPEKSRGFLPTDVAPAALDEVINTLNNAGQDVIDSITPIENQPSEIKLRVGFSDVEKIFTLIPDGLSWKIVAIV